MNLPEMLPDPPDDQPFVHEECGDTMWDAVLDQPAYSPPTAPVLPTKPETDRQKDMPENERSRVEAP